MSTQAYERIQAKLKSAGKEYFEGFLASDFVGLTEDELAEARGMLRSRARQGDGVSLDALQFVMPRDEYISFVEGLLPGLEGADLFMARLATIIVELAPSDSAWQRLLYVLQNADQPGRLWLVNQISSMPIPDHMRARFIEVLATLLLRESDSVLRLGEAVTLLKSKGFVPRSAEIADYAKRLQSQDAGTRLAALTELGCAPSAKN